MFSLISDPVTDPRSVVDFLGGESVAIDRLHHYLWETDAIATYKETRNGRLLYQVFSLVGVKVNFIYKKVDSICDVLIS